VAHCRVDNHLNVQDIYCAIRVEVVDRAIDAEGFRNHQLNIDYVHGGIVADVAGSNDGNDGSDAGVAGGVTASLTTPMWRVAI
jgi:hypothetical protein